LKRPYRDAFEISKWQRWEVPLIRWLARQGIAVELCTATDIHKDQANHAGLLQNYQLLVSVGHDEYWSKEMRDNVESFAEAGGNVAFFSANVCWWQIRFALNVDRQICYKDARLDPYTQNQPDLATVNWYDQPVNRSETSLTGVSYFGPTAPASVYRVLEPDHWAFAGLNFDTTSFFGLYKILQTVVGPETDKYQDGQLKSPANFLRLADIPPLSDPHNTDPKIAAGTMGIFTKGKGQVFTVGTINWSLGLSQDGGWNEIDQITRNVFDQLG
jgi:N,N-dimethylformamidase beta subunit-like protein